MCLARRWIAWRQEPCIVMYRGGGGGSAGDDGGWRGAWLLGILGRGCCCCASLKVERGRDGRDGTMTRKNRTRRMTRELKKRDSERKSKGEGRSKDRESRARRASALEPREGLVSSNG